MVWAKKLGLGIAITTVLATLVVVAPGAAADESIGDDWRILFLDGVMQEPATDVVYNAREDGVPFRLGQEPSAAQSLRITLCNDHATDDATGVQMTLESTDPIFSGIRSDVSNTPQTPAATVFAAGGCTGFDFRVNLSASGTIGKHPMRFDLIWSRAGVPDTLNDVPLDVFVSSIFDPVAFQAGVPGSGDFDNHDLPRLLETTGGGNTFFMAARSWQPATIGLVNQGAGIEDLTLTLGTFGAATMAASDGKTASFDPLVGGGAVVDNTWRLDVTGTPAPGIYDSAFTAAYTINPNTATSKSISEQGLTTKFVVDYTPIVTAELPTAVTLGQGEFSTFNVRFRNSGNVALTDLLAQPSADGPATDFFFAGTHHYENDDATVPGSADVGDLAVGALSGDVPVTVSHALLLPGGTHRLAFRWNAWFLDTGQTDVDGSPGWYRVGGQMVDHDGVPATPERGQLYMDANFDGLFNAGDGVIPGPWNAAFVDLAATDPNGPSIFATAGALATADVTSIPLVVTLTNMEKYGLMEAKPRLKVGPGTPFFAPGNKSQTQLDPTASLFAIAAAGGAPTAVTFIVDLNAAWWQAGSVAPGSFDVALLLDATSLHSGERFHDVAIPFKLELVGFGPNVVPSVVSNDAILPGKPFNLNVKLQNTGDDVARNIEVQLTAPARVTALLDGFFAAHRNVSLRMGDFGAANYHDMVLAEALAERALSSPGGKIVIITVDRLAPGETKTITFELVADPNVIPGATYNELVGVKFADSQAARTFAKGPYAFVIVAGGDGVTAIVLADPTGEAGGFFSPGPGALAAAAAAVSVGATALRRRR